MPQKIRNHTSSRAALLAAFGTALVIAGTTAVQAGDNGESGDGPYKKFFNKMLSNVGLGKNPDQSIDYRERPPLVVPPTRDLPPPAPVGSLAVKNPEWPTDPSGRAGRNRTPDQSILAGDRSSGDTTPTSQPDGSQSGVWDKLTGWTKSLTGNNRESATFVHEPARSALTDPPPGYRSPAPGQPYGINGLSDKKSKPDTERQNDIINGK